MSKYLEIERGKIVLNEQTSGSTKKEKIVLNELATGERKSFKMNRHLERERTLLK
jgi:hypothetical protein